jgi:hypothetical protein
MAGMHVDLPTHKACRMKRLYTSSNLLSQIAFFSTVASKKAPGPQTSQPNPMTESACELKSWDTMYGVYK